VIKWAIARATAHATTGKYGSTIVPEITALDVLKRWGTDNTPGLPVLEALFDLDIAPAKEQERKEADLPKMVTLEQERVIVIEPISNGAIVINQEGSKEAFVFETPCSGSSDELEGAVSMLYSITEQIGLCGSKYDKNRIRIKLEHGHGYECTMKKGKCPICNDL